MMVNSIWPWIVPLISSNNYTTTTDIVQATKFTNHVCSLVSFLSRWTGRSCLLLLQLLYHLSANITHVCLLVGHLCFLLVIVALIQSIRPRFRLISPETREKHLVLASKRSQRSPAGHREEPRTTAKELSIIDEAKQFRETCSFSVTNKDIQTIHRRLSWAETQLELESVHWINQTALTFWPSIKTLVNKVLLEHFKADQSQKGGPRSKSAGGQLVAGERPKMSVYLSCRRKLSLLRRARSLQMKQNSPLNNLIDFVRYFFKILLVYAKQFLIDQALNVMSSFSALSSPSPGPRQAETGQPREKIDLGDLLKANKTTIALGKDYLAKSSDGREGEKKAPTGHEDKAKKIPASRMVNPSPRGLVSAGTRAKLRDRRLRLLHNIDRARDTTRAPKSSIIESLRLGDTLPVVSGIKFIEADNNILLAEAHHKQRHITPSDESNMRLLVELSYESDKHFSIELSSLPVLNRLRLTKLSFQLRFIVAVNHTNVGQDKNLEIFAAPDKVMFPFINQAKFALVDAFHIDWHVKRANETKLIKMKQLESVHEKSDKLSQMNAKLVQWLVKHLDPIRLVNHNLFKYLVHMALRMGQKWMKPFDIAIGERFLVRTLY